MIVSELHTILAIVEENNKRKILSQFFSSKKRLVFEAALYCEKIPKITIVCTLHTYVVGGKK